MYFEKTAIKERSVISQIAYLFCAFVCHFFEQIRVEEDVTQLSENKEHARTVNSPSNGTKLTFNVKCLLFIYSLLNSKRRASGAYVL